MKRGNITHWSCIFLSAIHASRKKKKWLALLFFLIGSESVVFAEIHTELTPENTIILSNETDRDFCTDFSPFLETLLIDWIHMKDADVPDYVKDSNVIILGGPDALHVGGIIREILTEEEVMLIRESDTYETLVKDSPWAPNCIVYVCAGSDRVFTKIAAEETLRSVIAQSENPEEWYTPAMWSLEEVQEYIASYQFVPDDEELSQDELTVALTYEFQPNISLEDAKNDVEHLFYLLSHGYCGYGYFGTKGNFEKAKTDIMQELETSSTWSKVSLSELIHDHLQFIVDGHFRIGHNEYYQHADFWCSRYIEIWKTEGEYYFISDEKRWKIVEINEDQPEKFTYTSLSSKGEPIYILGVLSQSIPGSLTLTVEDEHGIEDTREIRLYHTRFDTEWRAFEEKTISGIPVISVRTFSSTSYQSELEEFIQTAEKYRGEPYLILDIRHNGGGSAEWARQWIEAFTGCDPEEYFIYTILVSRTSIMGGINACKELLWKHPDDSDIESYLELYEEDLRTFEESQSKLYWTEPSYPSMRLIPNDTKIIVLTSGGVMSAAEWFVGYLRKIENVVMVGENTAGVCMFTPFNLHQLPHSKIYVRLPHTLSFPPDLIFIEGEGFSPDLWVPARNALDYVIAAIQRGII